MILDGRKPGAGLTSASQRLAANSLKGRERRPPFPQRKGGSVHPQMIVDAKMILAYNKSSYSTMFQLVYTGLVEQPL
jgi:hypothetical protein